MSSLIWSEGSDQRVKSTEYLIFGRSEFRFDLETEGEVIDQIKDVLRIIRVYIKYARLRNRNTYVHVLFTRHQRFCYKMAECFIVDTYLWKWDLG